MKDVLLLYAHSVRMNLRAQLQYPRAFFLQTAAQLVMSGGELLAVLLVIDRFQALGQWSGGDLMFFFGMMTATFFLCEFFFRGVTNFSPYVRKGKLDSFFVRPRGILTQVMCNELDVRRASCIMVGVGAMIAGSSAAGIGWTALKVLCLLLSMLGGALLVMGLFLIDASFSIFSVKSMEMINVLTYGGRSACQYPIDIYPKPIKLLFMFVAPFALTLHLPVSYILGKQLLPGVSDFVAFFAPLAGAASFFLDYCVFRAALRHYRSTGS